MSPDAARASARTFVTSPIMSSTSRATALIGAAFASAARAAAFGPTRSVTPTFPASLPILSKPTPGT